MGRSLAKNALLNLIGQALPIIVALLSIPRIIHGLGTDRFGILTLAWLVIGYFSLFDLGLGRAITQVVADRKNTESADVLTKVVWTALGIMLFMGIVGASVAGASATFLAESVFKVPVDLKHETATAFYILSGAIPVVVISAGFVGLLTAYDRFDLINLVRIPLGISNFIAPLISLMISPNLVNIIIVLVVCRLIATAVQFRLCLGVMPGLRRYSWPSKKEIGPLLRFGGWMSATNIVGPLMIYFDRFLIGIVVSISAVAFYATPYEMVTKILIFPGAISATLFPRFAALYKSEPETVLKLLTDGWEALILILFPVIFLCVGFSTQGLELWLGKDFSANSSVILQWLSIGILFNALAHLPFAFIQGAGRPDLSAKAHLIELIIYLPLLWWALAANGIDGAAKAWTARAALDCLFLCVITCRLLPGFRDYLVKTGPWLITTAVFLMLMTAFRKQHHLVIWSTLVLLSGCVMFSKMNIIHRVFRVMSVHSIKVRSSP